MPGVAGVTGFLPECILDGLGIVLPLLTPFMTWLRISFRERRSMVELSMNWNDMLEYGSPFVISEKPRSSEHAWHLAIDHESAC